MLVVGAERQSFRWVRKVCFASGGRSDGWSSGVGPGAPRASCNSGKVSRQGDDSTRHASWSDGDSRAHPSQWHRHSGNGTESWEAPRCAEKGRPPPPPVLPATGEVNQDANPECMVGAQTRPAPHPCPRPGCGGLLDLTARCSVQGSQGEPCAVTLCSAQKRGLGSPVCRSRAR